MASVRLGFVVVAALLLPGCCSMARAFCPVEQALDEDTRLTRETPDEALDYLVEAFHDRRVADIYGCLHPTFREQHGGFSLGEFTSAFDEYEDLFREDAGNLARAGRQFAPSQGDPNIVGVKLTHAQMGGTIVLQRRDVAFVRIDDRFQGEATEVITDLGEVIRVEGGSIGTLRQIRMNGLKGISADKIIRFELRREWLVRGFQDAYGIKFLERIEAEL